MSNKINKKIILTRLIKLMKTKDPIHSYTSFLKRQRVVLSDDIIQKLRDLEEELVPCFPKQDGGKSFCCFTTTSAPTEAAYIELFGQAATMKTEEEMRKYLYINNKIDEFRTVLEEKITKAINGVREEYLPKLLEGKGKTEEELIAMFNEKMKEEEPS